MSFVKVRLFLALTRRPGLAGKRLRGALGRVRVRPGGLRDARSGGPEGGVRGPVRARRLPLDGGGAVARRRGRSLLPGGGGLPHLRLQRRRALVRLRSGRGLALQRVRAHRRAVQVQVGILTLHAILVVAGSYRYRGLNGC